MVRTFVYVDGFNLYYRALQRGPYKWLDLKTLFAGLLSPENRIDAIRYYTANISGKRDPHAPNRQHAYLRALSTIPEVSIHRGNFLVSEKWAALAQPPQMMVRPSPVTALVVKTEEKGSDVNLASHLIRDAFLDRFDVAVVVSNDTDLVEPIRIVAQEVGKPVGLVSPSDKPAKSLVQVASFVRHLSNSRLAAAQFPEVIPGTPIRRPAAWATVPPGSSGAP
ncbi:MAG: NYN domain-containing protein [Gemmatimonadaceae bacterium]|nr:NYN domain-containing protein [Gemmatimonadaceae bacterium]